MNLSMNQYCYSTRRLLINSLVNAFSYTKVFGKYFRQTLSQLSFNASTLVLMVERYIGSVAIDGNCL